MTAHGGAEALSHLARRRRGRAKERYELVAPRMRHKLAFAQIRSGEIEDRAQD